MKHDVGDRGDSNVTPVKNSPFRAIVEYVARVSEEVPRDAPGGKIVEKMAGEDVPKLISAAEDSRIVFEPMVLRLTVSDPGMPEVVSFEEAAVASMLEETNWMVVETIIGDNARPGLVDSAAGAADLAEERSGPSPSDKEIGVPTVAITDVAILVLNRSVDADASDVTEGTTARVPDSTLEVGKVPVAVVVPSSTADGTTAVVDNVSSFSLDIDRSGFDYQY